MSGNQNDSTDGGEQTHDQQTQQGGQQQAAQQAAPQETTRQGAPQQGTPQQGGEYQQAAPQQGGYQQGGQYGGPSLTDKLQARPTVDYIKSGVAIYAVTGLGLGLVALLFGVVDSAVVDASSGSGLSGGFGAAFVGVDGFSIPISGAMQLAGILAVLFGFRFAERIDEDEQTVAVAAAVTVLVGSVVLWFLSALLASTQVDGVSLEFGNLLVNAVVGGLGVAVVGGGTAYLSRSMEPEAA